MVELILLPLQVKGSDYMVLDSYCKFVTTTAKFLDIDIGQKYISITIYISLGTRPSVCKGLAPRLSPSFMARPWAGLAKVGLAHETITLLLLIGLNLVMHAVASSAILLFDCIVQDCSPNSCPEVHGPQISPHLQEASSAVRG